MLQIFVSLALAVLRPDWLTCPVGWVIAEGVRETGDFVCRPERVGCGERMECTPTQPSGELWLRVYCADDRTPATTDGVSAYCSRLRRQPPV